MAREAAATCGTEHYASAGQQQQLAANAPPWWHACVQVVVVEKQKAHWQAGPNRKVTVREGGRGGSGRRMASQPLWELPPCCSTLACLPQGMRIEVHPLLDALSKSFRQHSRAPRVIIGPLPQPMPDGDANQHAGRLHVCVAPSRPLRACTLCKLACASAPCLDAAQVAAAPLRWLQCGMETGTQVPSGAVTYVTCPWEKRPAMQMALALPRTAVQGEHAQLAASHAPPARSTTMRLI